MADDRDYAAMYYKLSSAVDEAMNVLKAAKRACEREHLTMSEAEREEREKAADE